MSRVSLSLVIATRGRPQTLARTLDGVAACAPGPDEVLVVDGDPERSAEEVTAEFTARATMPVAYLSGVSGLTAQRNVGLDAARSELVTFCDDDVELDPAVFGRIQAAFADPEVVAATARIVEPAAERLGSARSPLRRLLPRHPREGTVGRSGFPRRLVDLASPRDLEFVHGCFMAARRDVAAEVRFDERLSGYALAEDEDFGYRMSRRGRVRFVPDAVVVHLSTGFRTIDHRTFNRTLVLNRAYLLRKNLRPDRSSQAGFALMTGVLAVHRLVNREWAGVSGILQAWRELLRGRRQPA